MEFPSYGVTKKLSVFIMETDYNRIPEEVIQRTKLCLLDWIGSAYSGKGSSTDRIIRDLIMDRGGKKIATLIGSKHSAPPAEAALYNGMISAVKEIDDVHEEASLHAGIGVIPAALAVAEYAESSGRELIASIVIGYDISVRVARAAGATHYHFWHSTGTCNTFGAAAASGKLLNLDEEKLTMTLGLSGTQTSGLWESINAEAIMAKHLHSGKASFNGIFSAFLAREGFKGSKSIIEGEKGFLTSSSKATWQDMIQITENFGNPFLIMKNFFKRYACCRACFEGIEGIHKIFKENHLNYQDIEKIIVIMKPMRTWMVGNENPKDIYEAKFSLPFCMALMAVKGDAGLLRFTEEQLNNPIIKDVMRKIKLCSDPDISTKARIEVICKDKTIFVVEPLCRSLSLQEVKEKFVRNMAPILRGNHVHDILSCIEDLEEIGDISEFTYLLKREPQGGFH